MPAYNPLATDLELAAVPWNQQFVVKQAVRFLIQILMKTCIHQNLIRRANPVLL